MLYVSFLDIFSLILLFDLSISIVLIQFEKLGNLGSTPNAVARHCILRVKQSTRRSDLP